MCVCLFVHLFVCAVVWYFVIVCNTKLAVKRLVTTLFRYTLLDCDFLDNRFTESESQHSVRLKVCPYDREDNGLFAYILISLTIEKIMVCLHIYSFHFI